MHGQLLGSAGHTPTALEPGTIPWVAGKHSSSYSMKGANALLIRGCNISDLDSFPGFSMLWKQPSDETVLQRSRSSSESADRSLAHAWISAQSSQGHERFGSTGGCGLEQSVEEQARCLRLVVAGVGEVHGFHHGPSKS